MREQRVKYQCPLSTVVWMVTGAQSSTHSRVHAVRCLHRRTKLAVFYRGNNATQHAYCFMQKKCKIYHKKIYIVCSVV